MKDLEKLKDDILGTCKGKFDIFYSEPILTSERENYVVWGGEDFKDFLSLAEKLNVKVIYFCGAPVHDEEDLKHHGKIGQIEVGFLYDGIFHVFVQAADWFIEEVEKSEEIEENEKVPKEILEKSVEELTNEMIGFINKEYKELSEINIYPIEAQRQFWLEMGLKASMWNIEPKIRLKLEKVESKVEKHFMDIRRKKEEEILPSLINECIVWCKKQGLTKMNKTNVNFFLNEKNITLTSVAEDTLYFKVNHELKKN